MRAFIAGKVEVGCERVEDLAAVCEVGFESEDSGVRVGEVWLMSIDRTLQRRKWGCTCQVKIEYRVALLDEFWDDMASSLS